MIFVFDRVENNVGKGENAGYQHFLLFPQYFKKLFTQGRWKSGLCGKELIHANLFWMSSLIPVSSLQS